MLISNGFIIKDSNNDASALEHAVSLLSTGFADEGVLDWAGVIKFDPKYNDRFLEIPENFKGMESVIVANILRTHGIVLNFQAIGEDSNFTNPIPFEYSFKYNFSDNELLAIGDKGFKYPGEIEIAKNRLASYIKSAKAEIDKMQSDYDELRAKFLDRGEERILQAYKSIDFLANKITIIDKETGSIISELPAGNSDINSRYNKIHRVMQTVIGDVEVDNSPFGV